MSWSVGGMLEVSPSSYLTYLPKHFQDGTWRKIIPFCYYAKKIGREGGLAFWEFGLGNQFNHAWTMMHSLTSFAVKRFPGLLCASFSPGN